MLLFAFLAFRKNKGYISAFISEVYNMFLSNDKGFSAKKVMAFMTFFLMIHIHYRVSDSAILLRLDLADKFFILLLFGIIFLKDITALIKGIKGGKDDKDSKDISDNKLG